MKSPAAGVMGPAPRLIIAMCQYRKGESDEARKTLASAIMRFNWSLSHADRRDHFIMHILRREAEAMILPDLPAFLNGTYQPKDNSDRLAILGAARFKNLTLTCARLYADSFAADPKLLDEPRNSHRFNAACVAALAGSGIGDDAMKLSAPERMQWRKQARQWLGEELNSTSAGTSVNKLLAGWQREPDLAGIRDAGPLEKLSAVEREECVALWARVAAMLNEAQ